MAQTYYSPDGNPEVWDKKPEGYLTPEEWAEQHPYVPPVPTRDEKLAALDAQYDADKAEIMQYYTEAMFAGNTETQAELKAEMAEIDATYVEDRKAIEDEPEGSEE
jgi:hypothetical protein